MTPKIWQFRGSDTSETKALSPEFLDAVGGSPLLAQLLYNRGIHTPADARAFLELEHYQPTSGLELPDMQKGIDRILLAIDLKEPILIYGDFDVDGITGTSVLYQTLKYLGAKVSYYIPDRATEGHGLNVASLCRLVSTRQLKLVITTDTGITNFAEVSLLNGLKVDTIITDHHELPENLPQAVANINPKLLPDQEHPLALMAGVGVAYKVCELLLEALHAPESFAESLLDLVAIGTVADLASLHKENRYLVYRGVEIMNRRQRLGVNEILSQAGTKPDARLTSETVGFTIGPRLNALGRLSNATEAVELLTTEDTERARVIAAHLEHLNRRRQELCDQTFFEAEKFMMTSGGLDGRKAIILASPDWNLGIIGIVASRLIEKYHVPVFMMVVDESKGEVRCSARSIQGFHLHEAMTPLSHYFIHFGGHSGAGGFSMKLEHLEKFKRELYGLAERTITEDQMRPVVEVDARLQWSQVNPYLVELLSKMEPFGKDNPSPLFAVENVKVAAQRVLGSEGKHMKFVLQDKDPTQPLDALMWNAANKLGVGEKLNPMSRYSFVVSPELNTFNNVTKVQLIIQDVMETKKGAASGKIESAPSQKPKPFYTEPIPVAPAMASVSVTDEPSEGEGSPFKWIDHRSRESVESFVGQLMLPLQDGRAVLLYHEGRKPDIPFLSDKILRTRYTLEAAEELILWDLPPDAGVFEQILQTVKPSVIHLVGGKYQTVPVYPVVRDYLKVLFQCVMKLSTAHGSPEFPVVFDELAAQLSSSRTVMIQGLMLLGRLGMVSIGIDDGDVSETAMTERARVRVNPQANRDAEKDIARSLEWVAFQNALGEVSRFRDWLLRAPLDTINASLQMSDVTVSSREELLRDGKPSGNIHVRLR